MKVASVITPAQAILEKNKNSGCSSLVSLFNVISTKLMRSEMASGIDDCIFEDALVEKENEEGTQHSLLVTRMKSPFQIMYYHVSKERKKLSFSCYEYPRNTRALRKPWIDNVIQQAIYSYQLQNHKKKLRKDLEKYTVLQSSKCHVPLLSHFDKNCFTLAAMDNFGNGYKIVYLEECILTIQL